MKDTDDFDKPFAEVFASMLAQFPDLHSRILARLFPEQHLQGLTPEQRFQGLTPEQRLQGLTPEQRLQGLTAEELEQLKRLLR